MSNLQIVLKQIFEEVKDGDCLGFLCAGIKHLPVEIATEGDCSHCATIWNVNQPNANTTTFNISEQSFSGGAFDQVSIIVQDGVYYAVNYTRLNNSERIYFKSLKQSVTDAQRKIGLDDALSQIGKKYGWLSLIFGIKFLKYLIPSKLRIRISAMLYSTARVCSTHCAIQYSKMGLINYNSEMFYDPIDIIKLDIFK